MPDIIRLHQVFKSVEGGEGRTDILNGVSLTIAAGEFVAIMGASGSGKSTLLNLIGLLDTPSSGSIQIVGSETSQMDDDQLARTRSHSIGFIFQSFSLLPYLTACQNVELPMGYTGRTDKEERSRHLLTQMQLGHRLNAYPTTLSGGEKQRVAIARSLANQPPLLLADEPTGALDSKTGNEVLDVLAALNRAGTTIVIVTHDPNVASRTRRILRMQDGMLR